MSGLVLKDLPIAVDFWKLRSCSHVKLFFLSHMHSDHINGLTERWPYPIYCSHITKKLLVIRFKALEERIHALDMNVPHILSYGRCDETITVTLIDARHCYGSCMFHFNGSFGKILYTGDFRFCPAMLYDESFIRTIKSAPVDDLYLDNTFCSPNCQPIQSREKGLAEIVDLIRKHDEHLIILSLRTLGKENMLIALARILQRRICVSEGRYKTLTAVEAPDMFTCDENEADIIAIDTGHTIPLHKKQLGSRGPILEIIPTGLNCAMPDGQIFGGNSERVVVGYSDHSTYQELHEFVKIIAPKRVHPILTASTSGRLAKAIPEFCDMQCFDQYLTIDYISDIDTSPVRNTTCIAVNCAKNSSPVRNTRAVNSAKNSSPVSPFVKFGAGKSPTSPSRIFSSCSSPRKALTFSSPNKTVADLSEKTSKSHSSLGLRASTSETSMTGKKLEKRKLSGGKTKAKIPKTANMPKGVEYVCD